MPRKAFLRDAADPVPDHLRCRRTDGKTWRCPRRALTDVSFCEYHYGQARRQAALRANAAVSKPKRSRAAGKSPDRPPEKKRRTGGAMMEELVRVAVRRQAEKRGEKGKKKSVVMEGEEKEVVIDLPNGVMVISPSTARGVGNACSPVERKLNLGLEEGDSSSRRRFRSKNLEPVPIGSIIKVACRKGFGRGLKRVCHRCGESKVASVVRCSSCRKECFCAECLKKWYSGITEAEAKIECPVCRGDCTCKACMPYETKDIGFKSSANGKNKDETKYAWYLISQLLPVLKRISQEQRLELEIEATKQGKKLFSVQLQVAECSHDEIFNCNYCRNSILDFHRSCPSCCYRLCLSCCREFRMGIMPGEVTTPTDRHCIRGKAHSHAGKTPNGVKKRFSSKLNLIASFQSASQGLPKWQAKRTDDNIPCPPKELGGCGDDVLNLRYISVGLTKLR